MSEESTTGTHRGPATIRGGFGALTARVESHGNWTAALEAVGLAK